MGVVDNYLTDPKVQKRKWLIAVAVGLFSFMAFLDASIVNIAVPAISKDLHISNSTAEEIISIYIMVLCMFSLLFGKLADKYGIIRIFRIGTIIFIIGSFMSGIRVDIFFLLFSRVVQGIGASMTLSTNYGIMTEIFPSNMRGRALGLIGSFVSLGSIAGSGIGGLILSYLDWSYIFWVNIPIGIVTIILGTVTFPKDIYFLKTKIDWLGFFYFSISILALFSGIITGQKLGFGQWFSIGSFIVCLLSIFLFIHHEKNANSPLIDFHMFTNSMFTISLVCLFLVFATTYFYNMVCPFYLEDALKLSTKNSGLLLMIYPFVMTVVAFLAGWLSDKIGPKITTFIGLVGYTISQALFLLIGLHTPLLFFAFFSGFLGVSYALFQSPNNVLIMSSASKNYLGIVGSIKSLFQYVGSFLGITFSTTFLYMGMSVKAGHRVTSYVKGKPEIFIFGMHLVFIISFLISFVALVIAGYRIFFGKRKKPSQS